MMDWNLLYNATIVVDNNVLQDFAELGRMDLLFRVFNSVGIPKTIYNNEIEDFVKEILSEYDYVSCTMNSDVSYDIFSRLTNKPSYRRLTSYDKQLIAIAGQNECYAGSNDGAVRKACEEFGIRYTGTLGVIGCTFQKGFIAKSELMRLIGNFQS